MSSADSTGVNENSSNGGGLTPVSGKRRRNASYLNEEGYDDEEEMTMDYNDDFNTEENGDDEEDEGEDLGGEFNEDEDDETADDRSANTTSGGRSAQQNGGDNVDSDENDEADLAKSYPSISKSAARPASFQFDLNTLFAAANAASKLQAAKNKINN